MRIHTLHTTQTIRATRAAAWEFFSDPRNLARITPASLGFDIVTPDLPARVHAGLMIEYRVRPLLGLPVTWLTEITHVRDGANFVDEQRAGPYALWHHEHGFDERGDGTVELRDRVTYALPFGPLGSLVHPWLVRPKLETIFAHRTRVVSELFGGQ